MVLGCSWLLTYVVSGRALQCIVSASGWVFSSKNMARVLIHYNISYGVLPPQKNVVMGGHGLGHQPGGIYPQNLWTRQIDVDGNWVVHGLSSGASRGQWAKICSRKYRETLVHHLVPYALSPVCSGWLWDDAVGTILYPTTVRPFEHQGP